MHIYNLKLQSELHLEIEKKKFFAHLVFNILDNRHPFVSYFLRRLAFKNMDMLCYMLTSMR